MRDSALEVFWLRLCIVIEEINNFAGGGFDGLIALNGGLAAARDPNIQAVRWIIQLPGWGHGSNVRLPRPRRDNHGYSWEHIAHGDRLADGNSFSFDKMGPDF